MPGGYIQFVLVRANIGAQFDIEFTALGLVNGEPAGDMALVITTLGSNLLVVTRVSYRVKYSTRADEGTPGHKDEPTMSESIGGRGPQGRTVVIDLFGGPTLRNKAAPQRKVERRKGGSPNPLERRSVISQGVPKRAGSRSRSPTVQAPSPSGRTATTT